MVGKENDPCLLGFENFSGPFAVKLRGNGIFCVSQICKFTVSASHVRRHFERISLVHNCLRSLNIISINIA